ncbi:hypothetical protein K438DRAFT_1871532, partial [Mycena galopus ATCC 62051]
RRLWPRCVAASILFLFVFLLPPLSFIQSLHSSSHLCDHYCGLRNHGLRLKRGKPVKSNTVQATEATDASSSNPSKRLIRRRRRQSRRKTRFGAAMIESAMLNSFCLYPLVYSVFVATVS